MLRKRSTILCSLAPVMLLALTGCFRSGQATETSRSAVIRGLAEQVIYPAYQAQHQAASEMGLNLVGLRDAPTIEKLNKVRAAWRQLMQMHQQAEAMAWGQAKSSEMRTSFGRWRKNERAVKAVLRQPKELTLSELKLLGSTARGIPALEELLFRGEDKALLKAFQAEDGKRMTYALLISQDLVETSQKLEDLWEPESGSDYQAFMQNSQLAMSDTVNGLVAFMELSRDECLGDALNKKTGGNIRPELLPYHLSQSESLALKSRIEGVRAMLHGGYDGSVVENSLLGLTGAEEWLAERINTVSGSILKTLDANESLSDFLQSQPESAEALYQELTLLLVYLRADLAGKLGVTLTFNDNDGD